jgi:hypothetical protein
VVNHRSRKKKILVLDGPNGPVEDQKAMLDVAVNFYKELFKKEDRLNIHLAGDFWAENEKITEEENDSLTAPFSEVEIKEAVFSCYADGAPWPDGISFLFYQKFCVVKIDLVNMFNDFFKGELDLYRLNFAMMSPIPKEERARNMKKFRPLSLINCNFSEYRSSAGLLMCFFGLSVSVVIMLSYWQRYKMV